MKVGRRLVENTCASRRKRGTREENRMDMTKTHYKNL